MMLSLRMLGPFGICDPAGFELSLPTRKSRALLAYLATQVGRKVSRERLMELLWGERETKQARQSLNHALVSVRRLGFERGITLLESDRESVSLVDGTIDIDIVAFQNLRAKQPVQAARLYKGPFLDGLCLPENAFEEWLQATRTEFHNAACDVLGRAADAAVSRGDLQSAIASVRRKLELDPLLEDAHRQLMQLLYEAGERSAALRQYDHLSKVLMKELNVAPSSVTRRLFEELSRDEPPGSELISRATSSPTKWVSSRPKIVVLPFENLDNSAYSEQFCEGLTEDLIATLTKIPELFVIASPTTAVYKGEAVNAQSFAHSLGVRYVLQGSIRIIGERLRCTAYLIDAKSNQNLWAEVYDRVVEDIFALQDEILRNVLIELQVRLTVGENARVTGQGTQNLSAWLKFIRARSEGNKFTREGIARARELFESSHHADPNWARPLAGMAWLHILEAQRGFTPCREESIRLAQEFSERAIAIEPNEPLALENLGGISFIRGRYDEGIAFHEKAVEVAPNDFMALAGLAHKLMLVEEVDRALDLFERARRVCPEFPAYQCRRYGLLLQMTGRHERAIEVLKQLTVSSPSFAYGHAQLAAVFAEIGQLDAANFSAMKALEEDPGFTATLYLNTLLFKRPSRREWLRALLTKAGLPE